MLLSNLGVRGGPGSETGGIWIKINMRDMCQVPEDLSTTVLDIGPACLTSPWEIPSSVFSILVPSLPSSSSVH